MKDEKSYRRWGSPELAMSTYLVVAGQDMYRFTHYHPATEIVLVIKGHLKIQIEKTSVAYSEGDLLIIPADVVHGVQDFSPDAQMRVVDFLPEAIALQPGHFFQQGFVQPLAEGRLKLPAQLPPEHPAYGEISTQMRRLDTCRIYEKDYKVRRFAILMAICTALMPWCQVLSKEEAVPDPDPGNEAVKQCMRYIHNRYRRKIKLADIAKECHLHPNYLCVVFKQYTGQTVFEFLTRYRVETAAILLRRETLPMGRIAELVGFRSESLFYQKFRQIMGTTPKAYAKQAREKEID